jgi:hypothetical protein
MWASPAVAQGLSGLERGGLEHGCTQLQTTSLSRVLLLLLLRLLAALYCGSQLLSRVLDASAADFFTFRDEGGLFDVGYDYT